MKKIAIPAAVFLLAACGGDEPPVPKPTTTTAAKPAGATGTAKIAGKVIFEGAAPAGKKIRMAANPECKRHGPGEGVSEEVVVGAGNALQNVLVYVRNVSGAYPTPGEPGVMDQEGCVYKPHVVAIQAGQKVKFKNSDEALHNVHIHAKQGAANRAMPATMKEYVHDFKQPEIGVRVTCDVHSWMVSYVHVLAHPFFAVTADGGAYEITNLPAGEYEVVAWHETLGEMVEKVTVADGGTASAEFRFGA
jgi:plastocyanin